MEKKCNNCFDDNIGCDVIKKMRKRMDALSSKRYILLVGISVIGIAWIIILSLFVYRTFCPSSLPEKRIYNLHINNNMGISEKNKAEIQTCLTEALAEVEERANRAYNEKFAALITLLSLFGVAWPLIVAYVNYKMNEEKLKDIDKLREDTKNALNVFQVQTCAKLGGIMAQMTINIKELDDKLYCTFITFILLYQGNSISRSNVLEVLQHDFNQLKAWRSMDKKLQVVRSIETFLATNVIDPQTREIIERLQEKAIKTDVKEQKDNHSC